MEIWKDIKDYESLYQVSNLGNIKSISKNIILKQAKDKDGYLRVNLSKNGKKKTFRVHQLVYYNFKRIPPKGIEIDHILEGNKNNNRLDNLQELSHRLNSSKAKSVKNKSSKYTGVCFVNSKNKWKGYIWINGKKKHLGYFDKEIDAHNAYQDKLTTAI